MFLTKPYTIFPSLCGKSSQKATKTALAVCSNSDGCRMAPNDFYTIQTLIMPSKTEILYAVI